MGKTLGLWVISSLLVVIFSLFTFHFTLISPVFAQDEAPPDQAAADQAAADQAAADQAAADQAAADQAAADQAAADQAAADQAAAAQAAADQAAADQAAAAQAAADQAAAGTIDPTTPNPNALGPDPNAVSLEGSFASFGFSPEEALAALGGISLEEAFAALSSTSLEEALASFGFSPEAALQSSSITGVTNEGTVFSQDPSVVATASEVPVEDVPAGVPEGAAFYNEVCDCFQVGGPGPDQASVDTPTEGGSNQFGNIPGFGPGFGGTQPGQPGGPGSPSGPVSIFFNSLLKKCHTPSSWLSSPPQPIQVTAFSSSGIRAVSFRVTNLVSSSQEVFPAKKATPVIFEKKFKEKDIKAGSNYKLEAQAVDTRGRFSGWKAANTTFSYQNECLVPWIQTTGGDVHANTKIDTPGGP